MDSLYRTFVLAMLASVIRDAANMACPTATPAQMQSFEEEVARLLAAHLP